MGDSSNSSDEEVCGAMVWEPKDWREDLGKDWGAEAESNDNEKYYLLVVMIHDFDRLLL